MRPGVPGKRLTYSHAAVRAANERLSSDESSEDGSDAKGTGLESLAKQQKSPKVRKWASGRSIKVLEGPLASRSSNLATRQRQTENAAQLHAPPDYSRLHRTILQWDYQHTAVSPPDAPDRPRPLPLRFGSTLEYIQYFEPLLVLEAWQMLVVAREDISTGAGRIEPVPCEVAGRQSVDEFVDVFAFVQAGNISNKTLFTDADVVLLRSGQRMTLAKVQSVVHKRQQVDVTLRCYFGKDHYGASSALVPRSSWEILKLFRSGFSPRTTSSLTD
jgi:senataxin